MKAKEPEEIMDKRLITRGNKPMMQVLIKWKHEETKDATWENLTVMKEKFPRFILAGEYDSRKGGMSGLLQSALT